MSENEITSIRSRTRWYVNFADFANMAKAFIGTNYLSVGFAFAQSGLLLGVGGLLLIAVLTDHCCLLIVKTKNHAINRIIAKYKKDSSDQSKGCNTFNRTNRGSVNDDYIQSESDYSAHFGANDLERRNVNKSDHTVMQEQISRSMSYGDVGYYCYGTFGLGIVNFFIALTQYGFCTGYFIFIGNTIHSLFPYNKCATDSLSLAQTCTKDYSIDISNIANISNGTNSTGITINYIDFSPDLRLLVISPILIFILFALIRNVRYFGAISVIANVCILFGIVSVFGYLVLFITKNGLTDKFEYYNLQHFAIFFGMITGAFEGIGLVIPIESSMVGNRHLFTWFLHGAIFALGLVLGTLGILGYLAFGNNIQQMLNKNLPSGQFLALFVNVGICVGVILTFPLQIFPVIEIIENYIFSEGRLCGPSKQQSTSEHEALISEDVSDSRNSVTGQHVSMAVPDSILGQHKGTLFF
ncbi:uncharacterized protein LOC127868842 isoform X2 [Dreissena polymorpha]|uniref:uncharacterized protein LOC127868842 isoform X2 n=1 Tax=Dreissena polymorpha TaxID=45954 RepID=UPI0022654697|nr:uncharacterized protein LOC127868842 isoform X2 [Dreissena polymorpha]